MTKPESPPLPAAGSLLERGVSRPVAEARYVCRQCGTQWLQEGKTLTPVWGPRGKRCEGRMEEVQ